MAITEGPEFEARAQEVAAWTPLDQFVRGLLTYDELAELAPSTTIVEIAAAFRVLTKRNARKLAANVLQDMDPSASIFRRRNRVLESLLAHGYGNDLAMKISQEIR